MLLQDHLSKVRQDHLDTASKPGNPNPYSFDSISDSLSNILTLSSSGICRILKERHRWPKVNNTVALADFLGVPANKIFELVRKDMKAEIQQSSN